MFECCAECSWATYLIFHMTNWWSDRSHRHTHRRTGELLSEGLLYQQLLPTERTRCVVINARLLVLWILCVDKVITNKPKKINLRFQWAKGRLDDLAGMVQPDSPQMGACNPPLQPRKNGLAKAFFLKAKKCLYTDMYNTCTRIKTHLKTCGVSLMFLSKSQRQLNQTICRRFQAVWPADTADWRRIHRHTDVEPRRSRNNAWA